MIKSWNKHEGNVLDTKNGYDIIFCQECGFKHIIPIPNEHKLTQIYKEEYYSVEKPLYIERMEKDKEWWDLVYSDRYDIFEQYVSFKNRSILDIGSGTGYFLLNGKNRGWTTQGIEPSRQAANYSKNVLGLNIIEDFLNEKTSGALPKFDVIHMSEVLEHISDPRQLLRITTSLLKNNGILCIAVPNDFNPIQLSLEKVDNFAPWWIAPPHHINYFDFKSLRNLIGKLNYEIILEEATFPIDLFLLMGDNYIGNDQKGRECHEKKINIENKLNLAGLNNLKRQLYQKFAELGIGREVVLYARNKNE
jgi:2-polyprenyl-3-methyl-5-hydroxy-6-metoxy-1,4-benzoquinol methylase